MEENDKKNMLIKSLNLQANYVIILTEDCFLLFEKLDSGNGKIAFWSSLYAITDLQLNKLKKVTTINFYDEEANSEYQLKLKVDNILLFRDSLVKKMRALKVKVESQKLIKSQTQYKRLSEKEIRAMKINDMEKNINELKERIIKGEITDYTVKTFSYLCGKAIEHFSKIEDKKYLQYMESMKIVFSLEGVDKLTKEMTKLEEETTNENNDKNKGNKVEKVEMSVVFEKDRHPSYSKNMMNIKKYGDLNLNLKNTSKFQEEYQTGFASSKRDIKPNFSNNIIFLIIWK